MQNLKVKGKHAGSDQLYEKDFYAWANKNAELLRAGRLSEVDAGNIAEELETMGRSEKRELTNRLAVLLAHLLKWVFQPELRSNSWKYTIRGQRDDILDILEESPSLRSEIDERLVKAYEKATRLAAEQTGLEEGNFPANCPYSFDQAMDKDFWPE